MSGNQEDEAKPSFADGFKKSELVIVELTDGCNVVSQESLEECVKTLKSIKLAIEQMDLISSNETIDDIPTVSLQYLLVEPYLAMAQDNLNQPIEKRASVLQECQKLYNVFMLNAELYGFSLLPSGSHKIETNDQPVSFEQAARQRQRKVELMDMQDKLKEDIQRLDLEFKRSSEESAQREMFMKKLHLWYIRSMKNLEDIARELLLLECRNKFTRIDAEKPSGQYKPPPLKTFVIPKLQERQKIFGLGYPCAPTQTVSEWYDQMVKCGRFPSSLAPQTQSTQKTKLDEEGDVSDEDKKMDDEEARKKRMAKDEYLDTHRTGWGNTFGKG